MGRIRQHLIDACHGEAVSLMRAARYVYIGMCIHEYCLNGKCHGEKQNLEQTSRYRSVNGLFIFQSVIVRRVSGGTVVIDITARYSSVVA